MTFRHLIRCFLFLAIATRSTAMTSSGKALPREKDGLTLNGAGRLRKGFIFNVYGRALYLDQKVAGTKDLSKMR